MIMTIESTSNKLAESVLNGITKGKNTLVIDYKDLKNKSWQLGLFRGNFDFLVVENVKRVKKVEKYLTNEPLRIRLPYSETIVFIEPPINIILITPCTE